MLNFILLKRKSLFLYYRSMKYYYLFTAINLKCTNYNTYTNFYRLNQFNVVVVFFSLPLILYIIVIVLVCVYLFITYILVNLNFNVPLGFFSFYYFEWNLCNWIWKRFLFDLKNSGVLLLFLKNKVRSFSYKLSNLNHFFFGLF